MEKADNLNNLDFFEKVGYCFGLYKKTWNALTINAVTFILLLIVPFTLVFVGVLITGASILVNISSNTFSDIELATLITFGVLITIAALLYYLLWPALVTAQLKSVKNEKISVTNAFNESKKYIGQFILLGLIAALLIVGPILITALLSIVLIGLLLLPVVIVWSIFIVMLLQYAPFILISKKVSAVDAVKRTYALFKKKWQWFAAVLTVNFLFGLLGIIPFFGDIIGVVSTIVYFLLPAYIFVNHIDS